MTLSASKNSKEKGAIKPQRSRLLRIIFWLMIAFFILFVLAAISAAYIWVNRYALMEDAAIEALAEQGIDGQLSIQSVTKTHAIIDKITLSENGAEFFSSQQITVDYEWRNMLKGNVKRIVFTRPKGKITLDKNGKIIDDWLPHRDNEVTSGQILPPEGIQIDQGKLQIISPFGEFNTKINGEYFTSKNFSASVNFAQTKFIYANWKINGEGDFDIKLKGETPDVKTNLRLMRLEHPTLEATDLHVTGDLMPIIEDETLTITGDAGLKFSSLITDQFTLGASKIDWKGTLHHDKTQGSPLSLKGEWFSDIKGISIPDPIKRRDLAKTVSLSDPLNKTPIAQNFGPSLTRNVNQLLTQSSLQGRGITELNSDGLTISLKESVTIRAQESSLVLTRTDVAPFYQFDKAASEINLSFHAYMTKPAGFSLRETKMTANSKNGWRLNGVKRFSADVSTEREWKTIGFEKTPARLSPFAARAIYKGGAAAQLKLNGAVNYDGILPGALVTELKTDGELTMDIVGGETIMHFVPKDNTPLTISRIETDTEWRAEDVSGRLITMSPLFRREGNKSDVNATMAELSFILNDRPNKRNFGLGFETIEISGNLTGKSQNWVLNTLNTKICSEDTPGPGTDIRIPNMALEIWRDPNTDLRFTMTTPIANATTQLVTATNLAIIAKGTPNNFNIDYSPGAQNTGRVKFAGDALPSLPMAGRVNYADDAFTGRARTNLPFGEKTPIDVSYHFASGAGTADVNIPELRFSPNGLQPQNFVKALKGKIAEVDGTVSAQIKLAFAAGQPLQSSGTAQLKSMNFGTLPGPLTNVNTELSFSSFFPLQSQGRQTLTVAQFDPGFPLEKGTLEFELIPDGVKVYSARWPIGTGAIALEPFDWLYSAVENKVVMRVDKVSLGEFLNGIGNGSLQATGEIEGRLPVILSGIDVKVEGGHLAVKDGGTIRYQTDQTNAAGAGNEYAKMAFDALQDFNYRSLTAEIDGPLDGAIEIGMAFDGSNKDVLNNQPFRFGINIEGELINIIRSFNTNAQIKTELARRQLSREILSAE